jgi:hypothetical protein
LPPKCSQANWQKQLYLTTNGAATAARQRCCAAPVAWISRFPAAWDLANPEVDDLLDDLGEMVTKNGRQSDDYSIKNANDGVAGLFRY